MTEALENKGHRPNIKVMGDDGKHCAKCREFVPRSGFYTDSRRKDGLRSKCKSCYLTGCSKCRAENLEIVRENGRRYASQNRDKQKAYKAANSERLREWSRKYQAQWRKKNPEKMAEKHRLRYEAMPAEKRRAYARRRYHEVLKHSAWWRVKNSVSSQIRDCLAGKRKDRRTEELLGYSIDELRAHLERQFLKGMSWDNYGEWHIDHILPVSSFEIDGPDSPDFARCWAMTNLRPLWAMDNVRKNAKVLHLC